MSASVFKWSHPSKAAGASDFVFWGLGVKGLRVDLDIGVLGLEVSGSRL